MIARKLVERVSARVFCHHVEGGGNPLTIFSSYEKLLPSTQKKLAQECDWESVFIRNRKSNNSDSSVGEPSSEHQEEEEFRLPKLSFYMPSGKQVSFCAHAAMGACLELGKDGEDDIEFVTAKIPTNEKDEGQKNLDSNNGDVVYNKDDDDDHTINYATIYDGDIVALDMETAYEEEKIPHLPTLYRVARDYLHVNASQLPQKDNHGNTYHVTMCNASIARPKTLLYANSLETLQNAKAPKPSASKGFERACKALNNTTGIYLYAKREEDDSWECRQFPNASGYPEDPATGIAAGALAVCLYRNGIVLPTYKMYQGKAMGKSSLIVIDNLEIRNNQIMDEEQDEDEDEREELEKKTIASFRLLGRVEVDQRDTIEVSE